MLVPRSTTPRRKGRRGYNYVNVSIGRHQPFTTGGCFGCLGRSFLFLLLVVAILAVLVVA